MTISESQAIHQHILTPAPGETADQMWARAFQFTNNVCFDNVAYALIKKTGGRVCGPNQNRDCDKIIEVARPYRIYDLVRNAGTPDAAPIFDYTGHNGTPADFAMPTDYHTAPPVPQPSLPPYPGDPVFDEIGVVLFADYALAGQPPNPGMGRWFGRTTYDYLAGMSMEDSIEKHRNGPGGWREVLGLPPI